MYTFEGLELNKIFCVLCDFCWFDFFHVARLSQNSGFFLIPSDFVFLVSLFDTYRWIYTQRKGVIRYILKCLYCKISRKISCGECEDLYYIVNHIMSRWEQFEKNYNNSVKHGHFGSVLLHNYMIYCQQCQHFFTSFFIYFTSCLSFFV